MWYRTANLFPEGNEKVLSEEDKGGYVVREISTDYGLADGEKPVTLTSAFSKLDNCYIGSESTAKRLMEKGIVPQKPDDDCDVCCIGFSNTENKWYGWSHRAIRGFGVGDAPETFSPLGSTKGKAISTLDEAKQAAIDFADSVG